MTLLALVRHGETTWNAERRLQGQEDVGLSDRGHDQVRLLAPLVAALQPTRVLRSPLLRCAQTATELDVHAAVDDRWMEADLGDWTGLTRDELVARNDGGYGAWRAGEASPPAGESLAQLRSRVGEALSEVRGAATPGETVLVVTHGGPIRAVCHLLLGLETGQLVSVAPASLTLVDLSGPRPRLAGYNLTSAGVPGGATVPAGGWAEADGIEGDLPD
ncbi:MAG: histidine phosphatase family protein [Actinobacteria bacterium]|nr:histidine phosphatase family protein [Actinomycetota bacterium]